MVEPKNLSCYETRPVHAEGCDCLNMECMIYVHLSLLPNYALPYNEALTLVQVLAPLAIGMTVFVCHLVAVPIDGCR